MTPKGSETIICPPPQKKPNESHPRRLIKRKRKKNKEISTLLLLKIQNFAPAVRRSNTTFIPIFVEV